jgi:hypothetical protein
MKIKAKIELSCKEPNTDSMLYFGWPLLKDGDTITAPYWRIFYDYSLTAYLMNNPDDKLIGKTYNPKEHGQIFRIPPEPERIAIMNTYRDKRVRKLIMVEYWKMRGCVMKYDRLKALKLAKGDFKYNS